MTEHDDRRYSHREAGLIAAVQHAAGAGAPVARTASLFGEHALGWLALATVGAVADPRRRAQWVTAGASALAAHAAAVALKRVVRRPRPTDPRVQVLVGTPSRLSFPSAHAASTTAFCVVAAGQLLPVPLTAAVVTGMCASRVLLGVHYPSDVAAGWAVGGLTGMVGRALNQDRS